MDHRQIQRRIALLFSDWRQDAKATIFDLEHSVADVPFVVTRLDPMQPLDDDFIHFIRDYMAAIASKAVDTCSDQKCVPSSLAVQKSSVMSLSR
jgi:hypothetical protein